MSESLVTFQTDNSVEFDILVVLKVSRIRSGIVEHFYLFPMGVTAKTLSARKYSKTTSEIMWTGGSTGHRITSSASNAWKTLSLSLVVHWSPHGLRQHLWTTPSTQKCHWQADCLATLGPISFGAMFGDVCRITTVVSIQFVPWTNIPHDMR